MTHNRLLDRRGSRDIRCWCAFDRGGHEPAPAVVTALCRGLCPAALDGADVDPLTSV
jgi:hypothetical protein